MPNPVNARRRSSRSRRSGDDETSGHDRWLVSYADFITLLFAFFVVMYALSTLNEGKYRVLSDAMIQAFRHEQVRVPAHEQVTVAAPIPLPLRPFRAPKLPTLAVDPARQRQEKKMLGLATRITDAMRPLVQSGHVRLTQTARGLAVEINASVLFAPAQAVLQPGSIAALQAVSEVLSGVDNAIHVEGHTDNIPIASAQYPSNWELASARASAVVRLLTAHGVSPLRLVALGYADNRPVENNDAAEGRSRNRRVTLFISADPDLPGDSVPATGQIAAAQPGG